LGGSTLHEENRCGRARGHEESGKRLYHRAKIHLAGSGCHRDMTLWAPGNNAA
jgi:hypothetical protein